MIPKIRREMLRCRSCLSTISIKLPFRTPLSSLQLSFRPPRFTYSPISCPERKAHSHYTRATSHNRLILGAHTHTHTHTGSVNKTVIWCIRYVSVCRHELKKNMLLTTARAEWPFVQRSTFGWRHLIVITKACRYHGAKHFFTLYG